jgi:RNA polymerase sigma-70 factor (ECF subfamily)
MRGSAHNNVSMRVATPQGLARPPSIVAEGSAGADIAVVTPDFATIYDSWFDVVHRWVRALGGPTAEIEDLVQEVFVVVQRKLPRFDGRNVAGWLYTITQRTVSDYRRRWWFRHIFLRPREISLEHVEADIAGSEQVLDRARERARFYRLVAKMNPRWRDTFVLFEVLGYSGEEIAGLRAVPHATVRTHLHRARKEFLELLKKEQRS